MRNLLLIAPLLFATAAYADVKQDIDNANNKWITAYRNGDAHAIAELYTVEGIILPPGAAAIAGRPGIQQFWDNVIKSGVKILMLTTTSIEQYGNSAREIGKLKVEFPGKAASAEVKQHDGKYVVVWKHIGDTWLLDSDIWNFDD